MKEKRDYKVETTKCPRCGAICLVGHDDDMQTWCANCELSFRGKVESLDAEAFEKIENNSIRKSKSGWIAYVKK